MLFNYMQSQTISLGWDFYIPVILFAVLCLFAVPVWVSIGAAAITMLLMSGALPLSLVGESLFDGIDAFALTAVPLFILTGDVLVRTGLSRKFLDVADALTCWTRGGFGAATVLVCGMFSSISGSDAAGAAAVGTDDHIKACRKRLSAPLCLCACGCGGMYRHLDTAVDCLYHYRSCAGYFRISAIYGGIDPGADHPAGNPDNEYRHEQDLHI